MSTLVLLLGALGCGLLGGVGRRWFGSDLEHWFWSSRGAQTTFLLLVEAWMFWPKEWTWIQGAVSLACVLWVQFQYWSRGHGAPADIGRDENPSPETIERYNERWYHVPLDGVFPEDRRYGFLYDFFYMGLRYSCPMLALSLALWAGSWWDLTAPCWWWPLLGFAEARIYAFCQTLAEREPWVFSTGRWWLVRGWDLAELLGGFNTFFWGYLLWRLAQ